MISFLCKAEPRWKTVLGTLAVGLVLAIAAGAAWIYAGAFDVAATSSHGPVTAWVLETARTQSVRHRAADIRVPAGLDDPARLIIGVEHFAAHCAICHGGPGVPKGDIGNGLNPPPPDLADSGTHYSAAELFWIIKHGIRMTGMPSWADHDDAEIWATVAFLQKLPGMTPEEYGKLVMAAMAQGGGHHHATDPGHADTPRPDTHRPEAHGHDAHGHDAHRRDGAAQPPNHGAAHPAAPGSK